MEYPPMNFDSPEEARAWLRKILGPATREITGEEREAVWTMLMLAKEVESTNNQRTITDRYFIAGREFHHTYGEGLDILEEVLPDDFQQS